MKKIIILFSAILLLAGAGCGSGEIVLPTRESKIPAGAVKMAPETDVAPPELKLDDYFPPVPVAGPVNTAGGEDSPFYDPESDSLYFFFTPDVSVPVEKQIIDNVTGIYVSKNIDGEWQAAERVLLNDPGQAGSDGCEFVLGNKMWFCAVRQGYAGIHWFTAEFKNNRWQNWRLADFNQDYKVGELHITADGKELYFHSDRNGGRGGLDIWVSKNIDGAWQEPENVAAINSSRDEGWPALSLDGNELWITKDYGIWRSKKINGEWQAPELIVSSLAGEATIDADGNVYFVHHYYKDDKMIEADIYFLEKK
ncbi:MAG: hypothetical protein PHW53_02935 [Patescibacteria group bacterium]|nr:hypothetical protein [Patescibacteria group bacterium]